MNLGRVISRFSLVRWFIKLSILAVVILYYFIQQWNSWFHTALYIKNRDMYPLQLWLREIVISSSTAAVDADSPDANVVNLAKVLIMYCAIVISILPMIIVYPLVQKYMVNGVMVGTVKGWGFTGQQIAFKAEKKIEKSLGAGCFVFARRWPGTFFDEFSADSQ